MRRQLLSLAHLLEQGTEPPMAARPDLYQVRSTSFVIKRTESWIDASAAAQPAPPYVTAMNSSMINNAGARE